MGMGQVTSKVLSPWVTYPGTDVYTTGGVGTGTWFPDTQPQIPFIPYPTTPTLPDQFKELALADPDIRAAFEGRLTSDLLAAQLIREIKKLRAAINKLGETIDAQEPEEEEV